MEQEHDNEKRKDKQVSLKSEERKRDVAREQNKEHKDNKREAEKHQVAKLKKIQ